MSRPPTVALLGTGAFATALATALVAGATDPVRLAIVGRSGTAVDRVVTAVRPVEDHGVLRAVTDLSIHSDLTSILRGLDPQMVIVCASLHSPYPTAGRANRWTTVLRDNPFGLTALLQAPLAIRAAQGVARLGSAVPLINACYPDVVNPVLRALALPILCGLGNAHTLSAALGTSVPMLAHHRHLKPGLAVRDDIRVLWSGDDSAVHPRLHRVRQLPRRQLNDIGAAEGGRLVATMLRGAAERTNLPGPEGLPGGYPVAVRGATVDTAVPDSTSLADAIDWNRSHNAAEGVVLDGTCITFPGKTGDTLRRLGVLDTDSIACGEWEQAADRLVAARERLSALPPLRLERTTV